MKVINYLHGSCLLACIAPASLGKYELLSQQLLLSQVVWWLQTLHGVVVCCCA
jgi:hypothetical protein